MNKYVMRYVTVDGAVLKAKLLKKNHRDLRSGLITEKEDKD